MVEPALDTVNGFFRFVCARQRRNFEGLNASAEHRAFDAWGVLEWEGRGCVRGWLISLEVQPVSDLTAFRWFRMLRCRRTVRNLINLSGNKCCQ